MLVEKDKIIDLINNAEKELEECYKYLLLLKSKSFNGLEKFQLKLADTLYSLSDLYETIKNETRSCNIQNKAGSKPEDETQLFLKAIKKLIKIGKNMGDLFAWYFYKDTPKKIEEHLNHQVTGLFTPRLGGIGEIEFLKRFQFVGGCLLILHANTNMLRIADFSIFSPIDGIIGTVEIKTKKADAEGQADICAHIVTERTELAEKLYAAFAHMNNVSNEEFMQPYILNRDRFEKQVNLQKRFVTIPKTNLIYGVHAQLDTKLIENAYKSGISMNKEKCIIAIVQKSTNATFVDRVSDFRSQLPEIEKLNEIVTNGFCNNEKEKYPNLVGELHPFEIVPHFVPLFFWNVDGELYKELLLEEISIYLLLNPTIFLECFERNGYKITVNNKAKCITMSKTIKGVKVKIDFNWIAHLLANKILTVNCVLEIINDVISRFEKNPNCKIEIQM